jgi:large subunit ribosomal protein L24
MNARKMRNRQIYYATHQTASAQLSSELSNDLKKKYGKRSIRVLEGDTVKVIRGEFSGVDGKVTKVSLIKNGINIEGVKKDRVKGDKFDVYINTTNIVITGINTDDKWRMNRLEGKKPRSVRIKPKTDKIEKKNDNDENKIKKDTTKKQKVNETKTEKEVN